MFASADKDKDGLLDFNEFALLYDNSQRSEEELRAIFARLDDDASGKIKKEEFVKFQRLHDDARKQKLLAQQNSKDAEAQRSTHEPCSSTHEPCSQVYSGPVTVSVDA